MRRNICLALVISALTTACAPSAPQTKGPTVVVATERELGRVAEQTETQMTAVVQAVEPATRTLTLDVGDGKQLELVAGDEIRNFDQIRKGDRVKVRYVVGVVLQLVKGGGGLRGRVVDETASRSAKGEKPAGEALRTVSITADVVAMDRDKQLITLQGVERTVDLKVNDPAQFENIALGDQVEATITQAAAISVEPAESP